MKVEFLGRVRAIRKERQQIQVVRDEDLAEQIGKDIYFDLVDPDKVRSFRVHDRTTFEVFKVITDYVEASHWDP
ncbi:ubiquitin carboxyl-terminal hydrolase 12-like protein [Trifolium pratense]|uniref:Ubiquitin carboxyl-terminal hydrolase 12-like protein n=1 Tax=Trifolium pratense TaxID=57577 RepID=A0A2K3LKY4_TRIPR|nr:ubiquitin carboxyl-terminal hydrolase 12-like protein [Trifolium pratense]